MVKAKAAVEGLVIGLLLGYPLSYFVQPGALRAKVSIGEYIQHIGEVLQDKDLASTAIGTWVVCAVVLTALGYAVGKASKKA